MNGQPTHTSKLKAFTRRNFIIRTGIFFTGLASLGLFYRKWKYPPSKIIIPGKIVGPDFTHGHHLRGGAMPEPSEVRHVKHVVVGGGISGLSAARWLKSNSEDPFLLLELERETGGNAISGTNEVSAYPWGAHYLPIPNLSFKELEDFLSEAGIITGYDQQKLPVYNEDYLCFDPEERLHIYGHWQLGLVPEVGVPKSERKEIASFLSMMETFKNAKGEDGLYAFDIPLDKSSKDEQFQKLDQINMEKFLQLHQFTSPHLCWYVEYCCRDDYGTNLRNTSAWAGIHYFAARRATASNADPHTVLTWPEGNAFLAQKLKYNFEENIQRACLVHSVKISGNKVEIDYLHTESNFVNRIIADKCILSTPQFVNKRIVKDAGVRSEEMYNKFTYAPWFIANLTVKDLKETKGAPLCWDNVFYNSKSLGYINATQQHQKVYQGKKAFTYYYPLTDKDPVEERKIALLKKHEDWMETVTADLEHAHPGISKNIENADVWVWGHGMIRPTTGFISSVERKEAAKPLGNKIFFAHSDLSGISIFEEAFYQGIRAARELLNQESV